MMRRESTGLFLIGAFQVNGEVMVSDPCYEGGDKSFKDVLPGTWNAYTMLKDEASWGIRNNSLIAIHESQPLPTWFERMTYSERLGEVDVDSGQMGIYDLKGWTENSPCEDDYDTICESTLSKIGAGMTSYGATSSSGFGDGGYDLVCKRQDGKIVALEVVFIPEDNDPRVKNNDKSTDDEDE